MSYGQTNRAALTTLVMVVVAILIIAALAVPLLFWQYRDLDIRSDSVLPMPAGVERIELNVTATVGELFVDFVDLPKSSVRVVAEVRGHAGLFGEASPLRLDITTSNDTVEGGSTLATSVKFGTYAPWPYYSLSETRYTVQINKTLRASLDLSVVTGGVILKTTNGAVLEGLRLNATSKGAVVSLENGTVLAGNVKIKTATGGTQLSWNNVTVEGDRTVSIGESSGKITARFDQRKSLGGTVEVLSKETAGKTSLIFRLVGDTSAVVVVNEGINEAQLINSGGFSGNVLNFHSTNYPTSNHFNVQVNNTIGGIIVDGKWTPI